jgi:hypothetical protein
MTGVMVNRRWLTLILLVAWVFLGPVGMAFDACAAMMALCDGGSCGVVSAVAQSTPSFPPPAALMLVVAAAPDSVTPLGPSALEPPPKSVRLSA